MRPIPRVPELRGLLKAELLAVAVDLVERASVERVGSVEAELRAVVERPDGWEATRVAMAVQLARLIDFGELEAKAVPGAVKELRALVDQLEAAAKERDGADRDDDFWSIVSSPKVGNTEDP